MGTTRQFDAYFSANYPPLARLAYSLTGKRSEAEDLAQEALSRTYERWDTVASYEHPEAWTRRVLVNLVYSRSRRRKTEANGLRLLRRSDLEPDGAELSDSTEAFWEAVRSLPQRQAQVVALRYGDDLTAAEISSVLELDAGTVRSHLYQARKSLAMTLRLEDSDDINDDETIFPNGRQPQAEGCE